jgi:hypothetical protein
MRFQPGNTAAQGFGRPKGVRNKLGKRFLDDCLADWEEHGAAAIRIMRIEDPVKYCMMMASILPKEIDVTSTAVAELTDDELDRIIVEMRARIAQAAPPMKQIEAKAHELAAE